MIGVIYRPPDKNLRDFIIELDQLVDRISKENKPVFLLGDWNINLIAHSRHQATGEFLELLYSRMFFPLIDRPTRITAHTASLIDNIFTNDPLNHSTSGIFLNDISDHLPIFSIISGYEQNVEKNKYFTFRDKNPNNLAKFRVELENVNWEELPNYQDPYLAYGNFLKKYTITYNLCFPLKKIKAKIQALRKPWCSKGLSKSVRKKNLLYKRFLNNPNPHNELVYKRYKNKLNHSIRIAKKLYYEKKIEQAKSSAKYTWRLLNEVLNKNHKTKKLPTNFKMGNKDLTDPRQIAEQFCMFFSNIGPNLANNIPPSPTSHRSFLSGNFTDSIFLHAASELEITEICLGFRSGTAAGYDNVSMDLVKDCANLICRPITHIVNLSIASGIVPDQLKIARVIPLFKSGDKSSFTNYRPVSVLPAFSKILERVIYNRLMNYLNKHKILSDNQFGFRKHHSTEYALTLLYDKLSAAIDNNEFTVGIFIDLSKAFDTVDHQILLDKLLHYGIRGTAFNWFASYLSNRQQFVQFNETSSSLHLIKCGVPQGSILGPLLFLIYVNDLCDVSKVLDFILFADDTNIFFPIVMLI